MLSGNGFLIGIKLKGALESIKDIDQTYLIKLSEKSVLCNRSRFLLFIRHGNSVSP